MSVRCLSPLFVVLMVVLIGAVSGATDLKRKVGDEVSFKPIPTLSYGNTITWKFRADAGGATDLKRKVGDEVSFKPIPTLSYGNTITWKFRADAGGVFRVIEFDQDRSAFSQNPLFNDNVEADTITGELTLKNLRKEHSGLYYFEINGKEQEQKFTLMVMGATDLKRKVGDEVSFKPIPTLSYGNTITWKFRADAGVATDLKRKVGDEVSFKPNPTLSSGNTITWKFRADAGGVFRVIELDHGESASAQNPLFKDNAAADTITGELTLKHLRKEHSGLYYFEINGKEQEQKFTLMVMEREREGEKDHPKSLQSFCLMEKV